MLSFTFCLKNTLLTILITKNLLALTAGFAILLSFCKENGKIAELNVRVNSRFLKYYLARKTRMNGKEKGRE